MWEFYNVWKSQWQSETLVDIFGARILLRQEKFDKEPAVEERTLFVIVTVLSLILLTFSVSCVTFEVLFKCLFVVVFLVQMPISQEPAGEFQVPWRVVHKTLKVPHQRFH